MKSALSIPGRLGAILMALALLVFTAGCSKHEDDCPAPEGNDQQAATRAYDADQGTDLGEGDKPSGLNLRNSEGDTEETGGEGISDDGDDEADGEGNKKTKPAN